MVIVSQQKHIYQQIQKKKLTKELRNDKVKVTMVNEKNVVRERTILENNFIRKESKKEEVLVCYFVTIF
ncbi:MAG: hypothetical protein ABIB46_03385 [bacterium]